jgi:hypothetical protein
LDRTISICLFRNPRWVTNRNGRAPAPREPPYRRAVDEVELLDSLGIGLAQRDLVLELIVPARQVAEAGGGIAVLGLADELHVHLNGDVPERDIQGNRFVVAALDSVITERLF